MQPLLPGSTRLRGTFTLDRVSLTLASGLDKVATLAADDISTLAVVEATGAKNLSASLGGLQGTDLSTPDNLYEHFIKQSSSLSSTSEVGEGPSPVLSFSLSQSPTNDSDVKIRLAGLVVSPTAPFAVALSSFVSEDMPASSGGKEAGDNPTLERSVTTGVYDLFYDANAGSALPPPAPPPPGAAGVGDAAGAAFKEAWRAKVKTSASWTVDCDLKAPTVILPLSPGSGKRLTVNLGHFRLRTTNDGGKGMEDDFDGKEWDGWRLTASDVGASVEGCAPGPETKHLVADLNASLLVGFERAVGKKALTCVRAEMPKFDARVTPGTAGFLKELAEEVRMGRRANRKRK